MLLLNLPDPGGAMAKQLKILSIYEKEIDAFSKGDKTSEVFICFPSLILQNDKNIKKKPKIYRNSFEKKMPNVDKWLF